MCLKKEVCCYANAIVFAIILLNTMICLYNSPLDLAVIDRLIGSRWMGQEIEILF
jgi:hypothetical protein